MMEQNKLKFIKLNKKFWIIRRPAPTVKVSLPVKLYHNLRKNQAKKLLSLEKNKLPAKPEEPEPRQRGNIHRRVRRCRRPINIKASESRTQFTIHNPKLFEIVSLFQRDEIASKLRQNNAQISTPSLNNPNNNTPNTDGDINDKNSNDTSTGEPSLNTRDGDNTNNFVDVDKRTKPLQKEQNKAEKAKEKEVLMNVETQTETDVIDLDSDEDQKPNVHIVPTVSVSSPREVLSLPTLRDWNTHMGRTALTDQENRNGHPTETVGYDPDLALIHHTMLNNPVRISGLAGQEVPMPTGAGAPIVPSSHMTHHAMLNNPARISGFAGTEVPMPTGAGAPVIPPSHMTHHTMLNNPARISGFSGTEIPMPTGAGAPVIPPSHMTHHTMLNNPARISGFAGRELPMPTGARAPVVPPSHMTRHTMLNNPARISGFTGQEVPMPTRAGAPVVPSSHMTQHAMLNNPARISGFAGTEVPMPTGAGAPVIPPSHMTHHTMLNNPARISGFAGQEVPMPTGARAPVVPSSHMTHQTMLNNPARISRLTGLEVPMPIRAGVRVVPSSLMAPGYNTSSSQRSLDLAHQNVQYMAQLQQSIEMAQAYNRHSPNIHNPASSITSSAFPQDQLNTSRWPVSLDPVNQLMQAQHYGYNTTAIEHDIALRARIAQNNFFDEPR